jgi:hypothetical protein
LLRTGPRIDGIFGFSQGAALTGLLAALRDTRHQDEGARAPGGPRSGR